MNYTKRLNNIYLQSTGVVGGHLEYEGPIGNYLDEHFKDCYFGQKTFEDGEIHAAREAIRIALDKANLDKDMIKIALGGDLSNQIAISNEVASSLPISFLGQYGACASSMMILGLASILVDYDPSIAVLTFCSSNYATAERQFRYPIDYGLQKKATTTVTVSGAAASIVSSRPTKIAISAVTFGKVKDASWDDVNDMGSPMALAAYDTLMTHLRNMNEKVEDYDLILTGDLSEVGKKILIDCLKCDGINLSNYEDCGNIIYDAKKQNLYCGGSGVACSAIVTYGYVVSKLLSGDLKRVLIISTGALFSPTLSFQKHTIPIIAHGVVLEGNL